ncbi:N/A [soil metagenome]
MSDKEILIVDDDSKNIFALKLVLQARGYPCVSAIDGITAIKIAHSNKNIGIILMDMMMPDMDGYESIGRLKEDIKTADIPVISVTAQAMPGDKEKCLEAGADGYVSKPIDVDELLRMVDKLKT